MMAGNPDWWSMHLLSSICPQNVSHVTSLSRLDFSYNKADHMKSQLPDHTSKVRKEKLGDRIKTLHQLVSPFGKTDTASVLIEAIGYIRFLHSQIEDVLHQRLEVQLPERIQILRVSFIYYILCQLFKALSYPYLGSGSENMRNQQSDAKDKPKDLRSRGLCLVPVSFTQHVGK